MHQAGKCNDKCAHYKEVSRAPNSGELTSAYIDDGKMIYELLNVASNNTQKRLRSRNPEVTAVHTIPEENLMRCIA